MASQVNVTTTTATTSAYLSGVRWNNPTNVYTANGNDATAPMIAGIDGIDYTDWLNCTVIGNETAIGTYDQVNYATGIMEIARAATLSASTICRMEFYNGSSWCSGHTFTSIGTSDTLKLVNCSHHGWNKTERDALQLRARCYNSGATSNGDITVDVFAASYNYDPAVAPSAPADPSITADGVGDATVSSNSPFDGYTDLDNVHHQISQSSTFASGNIDYYKGSAPSNPQTHQFTGLTADGLYYARARYHNAINWGGYNSSPYNSDRIWDQSNAPAWAGTKFTARTASSITFDWVTPTDLGNSSLVEYDYAWGLVDPTPDNIVDTNSTNTIATKSSLSPGSLYYFMQRAVTQWGDGEWNAANAHWTLCATPSTPTVTANAVGSLRIQHADVTGLQYWRVMRASTSGGTYSQVYLSGSGATTLDWSNTSLGNNATWYYKIYARNADSNDSILSAYASATTWDLPDSQDLLNATTPENSMIRVTRDDPYPDGNGEPVDSWDVWRATSSGGVYSELATGLTAISYDDWSVDGGETWYYKAKFTNLVGDSAISTNSVSTTALTSNIQTLSDTSIRLITINELFSDSWIQLITINELFSDTSIQLITTNELFSDTAIFQAGWDTIIPDSNTAIFQAASNPPVTGTLGIDYFGYLDKDSDSWITWLDQEVSPILSESYVLKIGELSRVSNTRIYNIDLEITALSDTAIHRSDFDIIESISDSVIKRSAIDTVTKTSFSRIENSYENTPFSDSTIFHPSYGDIQLSSDTRIVLEGTIVAPPVYSDTIIKYFGTEITPIDSDTFIILNIDIPKLSDTIIFYPSYGLIELSSDTAIFRAGYNNLITLSDTVIYVGDNEITTLSDTVIKRYAGYRYPLQRQLVLSDSRILTSYTANKNSYSFITLTNSTTKLSDTLIIYEPIIDIVSDTVILEASAVSASSQTRIKKALDFNVLSDSTIFRADYGLDDKSSGTSIHREPIIDIASDSSIQFSFETSEKLSDTYIINAGTLINKYTNTAIFKAGTDIFKGSRTIIFIEAYNDKQILSDSRIKRVINKTMLSDTAIRRDRANLRAIFQKGRQL